MTTKPGLKFSVAAIRTNMRSTVKDEAKRGVANSRELEASRVLEEARCQACSTRMPQFDGRRVALSATVACTVKCWESLSAGRSWGPSPFDDEPTIV
jgi:hypothetical protein